MTNDIKSFIQYINLFLKGHKMGSVGKAIGGAVSGTIGLGTGLVGSVLGGPDTGGYEDAAQAQTQAARENIDFQKWLFNEQKELNAPWRQAGEEALSRIEETPNFSFSAEDFEKYKDPSYDFRMQEGVNALDRSAASRGRVLSGAQGKAVTRYGQNMASQEYQNAFSRSQNVFNTNMNTQKSLAGVGQQAVGNVQQAGNIMGQSVSQANMDIGNALAQSSIQSTNAQIQGQQNLLGTATSLGGAALMFSDKRLKKNIERIGRANGHNIYKWEWKDSGRKDMSTGVIAQEVMEINPEAVTEADNGYLMVDYSKLGVL